MKKDQIIEGFKSLPLKNQILAMKEIVTLIPSYEVKRTIHEDPSSFNSQTFWDKKEAIKYFKGEVKRTKNWDCAVEFLVIESGFGEIMSYERFYGEETKWGW